MSSQFLTFCFFGCVIQLLRITFLFYWYFTDWLFVVYYMTSDISETCKYLCIIENKSRKPTSHWLQIRGIVCSHCIFAASRQKHESWKIVFHLRRGCWCFRTMNPAKWSTETRSAFSFKEPFCTLTACGSKKLVLVLLFCICCICTYEIGH